MGIAVYPAAGGGVTQKVQEFTSTGTFTAPSNCSAVEVFLVGGGGSGGGVSALSADTSVSGGGGGGAVIRRTLSVTPGSSYTVTIGAGGTASSGTRGSSGGNTSFGALATAVGGGAGGAGATGNTNQTGLNGGSGGGAGIAAFGGGNTGRGGDGGGAGGNANAFVQAGNTSFQQPDTNSRYGYTTSSGGNGFSSTSNSTVIGAAQTFVGIGIDGYGYGGCGGQSSGTNVFYPRGPVLGGWASSAVGTFNGSNAAANTGNGGGGAAVNQNNTAAIGGNGGSGYARVTYWS